MVTQDNRLPVVIYPLPVSVFAKKDSITFLAKTQVNRSKPDNSLIYAKNEVNIVRSKLKNSGQNANNLGQNANNLGQNDFDLSASDSEFSSLIVAKTNNSGRYYRIMLTINNPEKFGVNHDMLKELILKFNCYYYCICDEIGNKTQTYHTHVFMFSDSNMRFTTLKKRFPWAHITPCNGTPKQCRDYALKQGAYLDDPKHDTSVPDTFEEFGTLPIGEEEQPNFKKETKQSQQELLVDLILRGWSDYDIVTKYPKLSRQLKNIDPLRQVILYEPFKRKRRKMHVYYVYGATGVGKSHFVRSLFAPEDTYTVSDYSHPLDDYSGQRCVIFEEFRSDIPVRVMLQYLDKYPCYVSARYANKVACYDYVFVVTNDKPRLQYNTELSDDDVTRAAFYRRFDGIFVMYKDGNKYGNHFYPDITACPFSYFGIRKSKCDVVDDYVLDISNKVEFE